MITARELKFHFAGKRTFRHLIAVIEPGTEAYVAPRANNMWPEKVEEGEVFNLPAGFTREFAAATEEEPVCECGHPAIDHGDEDYCVDEGPSPRPCELCTCRRYWEE